MKVHGLIMLGSLLICLMGNGCDNQVDKSEKTPAEMNPSTEKKAQTQAAFSTHGIQPHPARYWERLNE